RAVGSILNALQAAGLADDTLVIFTSDHGEMMGDHHQLAKGVMYQEAVRIPLLMRAPWLSRQQSHLPGHVSQIDLLPTILDLSGNEVPSGLAGTSRQDVVTGSATLAENDVFFIWHGDEYTVGHIDLPGATPEELAAVGHQDWHCVVSHEGWKL